MIRVHQIALPLDHPPEALPKAVAKRLKLPLEALGELQLFRRSVDARHKGAIELVYSVDVPVADDCLLYTSPSPRDLSTSRMPSSA